MEPLFLSFGHTKTRTWFIFHLLLGLASTFNSIMLIAWFYIALVLGLKSVNRTTNSHSKVKQLLNLWAYLSPFEIICRMANTTPAIPYEISKYLSFFLLIWAFCYTRKISKVGLGILILLIPGVLFSLVEGSGLRIIVYNALGLINIGLGITVFSFTKIESLPIYIENLTKLILFPLISALFFVIIKTPNLDTIEFSLGANFETSGGFGSNQVSTALGLGFFLAFYLWYKKSSFSGGGQFLDLMVVIFFLYQGLLTFSRGGVIGGVLGVGLLVIASILNKATESKIIGFSKIIIVGLPLFLGAFMIVDRITDGNLSLRYAGETQATLKGTREKDINQLTTNRYSVLLEDINLFYENPIFGVGIGKSKDKRQSTSDIAAHVELSRLLAEHGFFGLGIVILMSLLFFEKIWLLWSNNAILFIFLTLGIYTTFHAATRTFISPLLISIGMLVPMKMMPSKDQNKFVN